MKHYITYLLFMLVAASAAAQINVTGTIIDKEADEPLAGASVIVKGADGKIKKFATSKADGGFSLLVPSVADCRLEVTMMSFERQSLPLDSLSFPVTIYMSPGSALLKEVTVKADRIREQGDTITYNVATFAQKQDRSIGDVLRRMPGIDVAQSGKIQYQGTDINKFYIEGSDLLGGKYGLATNGINHDDVGAVEVMENHQPMQVLAGISFSDKAAINLKLKNKAKATWNVHGDAGGGYSWQPEGAVWYGDLFAMAVMPSFQNITTIKTNNTGQDLSANVMDFLAGGRSTDLSKYLSVALPSVPGLNRKRTLFNRSAMISTNSLWKMGRGELKTQVDYSFNHVTADATSLTTYFLTEGDRVITENRDGTDRSHSLSGKVIYELNQRTAFINNTLKTNIDWDDLQLGIVGSLTNDQTASFPDYYISNDFKLIKRFNREGGRSYLVTFTSLNEWESLPQTLNVTMGERKLSQHVGQHAFVTRENIAYAFSFKGITVSIVGGVKGYFRSMDSSLDGDMSGLPSDVAKSDFVNVVNTNYFTLYATPKLEYWIKRVNFSLNAPVSYAAYQFDKALANRSEGYFSPSLSINWKPNNKCSFIVRGATGRSPMSLHLIQPGYIMTGYRSFRRGVDDFYSKSSKSLSSTINYKNTRRGIFANSMIIMSWNHTPYTTVQQLFGDYIAYSYSDAAADGNSLMANGNIGKTLDFINGSCNLNGSFSRSESNIIYDNHGVSSVTTAWSAGAKVSGSPTSWLGIDYKFNFSSSRLAMNQSRASWLESMQNEFLLNIIPVSGWQWHLSGEHYRNQLTADTYKNMFMLDTKVIYRLSKRLELSAALSNILNSRSYNYITYNDISSFESQRRLRGRQLLFTISLRK